MLLQLKMRYQKKSRKQRMINNQFKLNNKLKLLKLRVQLNKRMQNKMNQLMKPNQLKNVPLKVYLMAKDLKLKMLNNQPRLLYNLLRKDKTMKSQLKTIKLISQLSKLNDPLNTCNKGKESENI